MRPIRVRLHRPTRATLAMGCVATAFVVPLAQSAPAGAEVLSIRSATSIVATLRGNGHGHGLSQYGARAAAAQGRTYAAILSFYYPGTTLTTLPQTSVKVLISGVGKAVTVQAQTGLRLSTGKVLLPVSGIARYRLVADSGSGLTLQQLRSASGSSWTNYRTGLADGTSLYRREDATKLYDATGGASSSYLGYLTARRAAPTGSSAGVLVVNRVDLDQYTAGVVGNEVPTSWPAQAVFAQAVAARSYARYAVEHPTSSTYDICDTSQCQVYAGHARYDSAGRLQYTDYAPAATATARRVLRYGGATIFAQFGASNGGWTVAGGQPYLVARSDPYDPAGTANPYKLYTARVPVGQLAAYVGLSTVTSVGIAKRDGNGAADGRVLSAYVTGTDSAGRARTVRLTGAQLQYALGVGTTWIQLATG